MQQMIISKLAVRQKEFVLCDQAPENQLDKGQNSAMNQARCFY